MSKTVEEWLLPKLPVILCGASPEKLSKDNLDGLAWTIAKSAGLLKAHIYEGDSDSISIIPADVREKAAEQVYWVRGDINDEPWETVSEHVKNACRDRVDAVIESLNITVVNLAELRKLQAALKGVLR